MVEAASKDVAPTLRSFDAARGHEAGHRYATLNEHDDPPVTLRLPKRRHDRNSSGHTGLGLLHPHQRSGSSATCGDQVGMPPPKRLPTTRIRLSFSSHFQGDVPADTNASKSYKFWDFAKESVTHARQARQRPSIAAACYRLEGSTYTCWRSWHCRPISTAARPR